MTSSRWKNALPRLLRRPMPKLAPDEVEERMPVVDLSHFAAIGGLTKRQYLARMITKLRAGRIADVLRPEAMEDLLKSVEKARSFMLVVQMSLNKPVDACLYCSCQKIADGIKVGKIVPGVVSHKPKSAKAQSRTFEVAFCDMRSSI